MAAFNGRLGATKALLARGADGLAKDAYGFSALDNAKYRLTECPCQAPDPQRQWGGVLALLEAAIRARTDGLHSHRYFC